ncbi:hypothetical protein [Sinorhizobium sp. BJ1]|uniref:hypothetical protein n=1 Tax=Sinorhizobium sp. BJ1 TaxID=2035455 RepID=UPI0015CF7751|nr:hypothetical protein [Sinorhizobium sp. BJ1]
MTTAKAAILRPEKLKSEDRGAPTASLGTPEGSTKLIKGITVFRFGVPIRLHKSCEDCVMVLDDRRSHKSTASTANLFQTMRPKSDQRRRTAASTHSEMHLMRVHFHRAPNVTRSEAMASVADDT